MIGRPSARGLVGKELKSVLEKKGKMSSVVCAEAAVMAVACISQPGWMRLGCGLRTLGVGLPLSRARSQPPNWGF